MKIGSWCAALCALAPAAALAQTTAVTCHSSFFTTPKMTLTSPVAVPGAQMFADVDGDGVRDWIVAGGGQVVVAYRNANGSIRSMASSSDVPWSTLPGTMAHGDLDGVKGEEIVVQSGTGFAVLKAGTAGALTVASQIAGDPSIYWPMVAIGRFRGPGQPPALAVETAPGTITVETWASGQLIPGPTLSFPEPQKNGGPFLVAADVDGDGADDLLHPSADGIGAARLTGTGWQKFADFPTSGPFYTLAAGDFDGNGRTDVVALAQGTNAFMPPLRTWLQSPGGTFTMLPDVQVAYNGNLLLAGDLSGDGVPELVGYGQTAQMVNGAWQLLKNPAGFDSATSDLVDWNGDGLLDLAGVDARSLGVVLGGWADLAVTAVNPPAIVPAGGTALLTFQVTNEGPAATTGFSFTTSTPTSRLSVCPTDDCSTLTLGPGSSVLLDLMVPVPGDQFSFTVGACSTLFDRISNDDTASVSIPLDPRADLSSVFSFLAQNGTLTVEADGGNSGPSAAQGVTLSIALPPGVSNPSWTSSVPGASCTTAGGTMTCTLPALAPNQIWKVTVSGGYGYTGQSVTISTTIDSQTIDPHPDNNSYTQTVPALGPIARASSGCGCGVAEGPAWPPIAGAGASILAALWLARPRRRNRRGAFPISLRSSAATTASSPRRCASPSLAAERLPCASRLTSDSPTCR